MPPRRQQQTRCKWRSRSLRLLLRLLILLLLVIFFATAEETAEEAALFLWLLLLVAIFGVLRGVGGRLGLASGRQDRRCSGGRQRLRRTAEAEDLLEEVSLIAVGA